MLDTYDDYSPINPVNQEEVQEEELNELEQSQQDCSDLRVKLFIAKRQIDRLIELSIDSQNGLLLRYLKQIDL